MNEIPYPFTVSRLKYRYRFISISASKEIPKIVLITVTSNPEVYNLALLDQLETGKLSDTSRPDNKDFRVVLATVFRIVKSFLAENPACWVVFMGSDERRQRLYRIVLSRELEMLNEKFVILGVTNGVTSLFEVNKTYEFFLIGIKYDNTAKKA